MSRRNLGLGRRVCLSECVLRALLQLRRPPSLCKSNRGEQPSGSRLIRARLRFYGLRFDCKRFHPFCVLQILLCLLRAPTHESGPAQGFTFTFREFFLQLLVWSQVCFSAKLKYVENPTKRFYTSSCWS